MADLANSVTEGLREALAEARALGFLGPGSVDDHIRNAQLFATAIGTVEGAALDLGSGGGVPGLVLAAAFPEVTWVLLDVARRRTSFLSRTVVSLGWSARVHVHRERAEIAGWSKEFRGAFSLVTSRSFGPPPWTAECGAPFLAARGRLIVAEPPDAPERRWPNAGLETLGLVRGDAVSSGAATVRVLERVSACSDAYPRPRGTTRRRPLWPVPRETPSD